MDSCSGKRPQSTSASKNQQNQSDPGNTTTQKYQLNVDIGNLIITSEKQVNITKDYIFLNPPLGCCIQRAYGVVRKVLHKSTILLKAVKIIHKSLTSKEEQERLMNEVKMLQKLDHPKIIKIFEIYQDERFFFIVTELCTGGELFDKIRAEGSFSEKKAAEIIKQILIIKFKTCNLRQLILVLLRICSKLVIPYYIAREVLTKKYDEKCDLWSCGVILYILLCGYPSFDSKSEDKIKEKVLKGDYQLIQKNGKMYQRKLKISLTNCQRLNAHQALSDLWIKKYTINDEGFNKYEQIHRILKLQEAVFKFIVNQLATKEDKAELLKTFQYYLLQYIKQQNLLLLQLIDNNYYLNRDYKRHLECLINGLISVDELKENISGISEDMWKQVVQEFDSNFDGFHEMNYLQ